MNIFDSTNPTILNDFITYLFNMKQYSINTVKEYRIDLMVFFKFIKEYCNVQVGIFDFNVFILQNIKESDIIAFLIFLNYTKDNSASTRERKLCAIKCFYKWLFSTYSISNMINPTLDLSNIQSIEKLPKYLNLKDAKKVLNIFNSENSKFPVRNNTIICLFLNSGLRASELINIKINDVNLSDGYIRIIGKGNKERIVWLNEYTKKQIKLYLSSRINNQDKVIDISEPLFISYRNKKLGLRTVEVITENAFKLAGLSEYNYTTHSLRHTSATIMYKYVKSDILLLKEFLGHSTIKSTEIYLHIEDNDIRDAVNKNPLSNYEPKKVA